MVFVSGTAPATFQWNLSVCKSDVFQNDFPCCLLFTSDLCSTSGLYNGVFIHLERVMTSYDKLRFALEVLLRLWKKWHMINILCTNNNFNNFLLDAILLFLHNSWFTPGVGFMGEFPRHWSSQMPYLSCLDGPLVRPSCRNWQRSAASSLHSACHPERVDELTRLELKSWPWISLFTCNAMRRTFKMNSKHFKGRPSRVESCAKTKQEAESIGLLHSFMMFHDDVSWLHCFWDDSPVSFSSFYCFMRAFDRTINLSRASGLIVTFSCQAWNEPKSIQIDPWLAKASKES